ncbi:MAG: helix-turn-helix domain-containing protein [Flavobacteriaceae bacterium]|nr:helix-turn-helix domain-containing protein [Flavobacteriaceae bacterium]
MRTKILLLDNSLNVSEIAYEVGYNDPKYFSRIFFEEFSITPSKFNL